MSEGNGVHKRRVFRWTQESRELIREYKRLMNKDHDRDEPLRVSWSQSWWKSLETLGMHAYVSCASWA
ncbi:MAG: hypothetical protein JWO91_3261 [Acidobacteriaceae bacterium]|nr:hypothetical protein [Acidobacteriaceae bacterium]